MRPSELNICEPEEDLALMTAYMNAKGKMANWEDHIREIKKTTK